MKHQSDSGVQQEAEAGILASVAAEVGVELKQNVRLDLGDAYVQVDGASPDESLIVEVFARVGRLAGGQLHKVSTDSLKLIALRQSRPDARMLLAFASEEAASSVVGWRRQAIQMWGIEIVTVQPDERTRQAILDAQEQQKMVNPPLGESD
ncbi:MAG: hypothetical protein ACR2G3_12645 [Solirubrobacterales bacterium]